MDFILSYPSWIIGSKPLNKFMYKRGDIWIDYYVPKLQLKVNENIFVSYLLITDVSKNEDCFPIAIILNKSFCNAYQLLRFINLSLKGFENCIATIIYIEKSLVKNTKSIHIGIE